MNKLKIAKKGETVAIKKSNGAVPQKLRVELSWTPDKTKSVYAYDFDASAAITKGAENAGIGKIISTDHLCFYFQQETLAIKSLGDNRSGGNTNHGEKVADETLLIDLTKIPVDGEKVQIFITLDSAKSRGQSFNDLPDCTCSVFDDENNEKLFSSVLDQFDKSTMSVLFASLIKQPDGSYTFENISKGFTCEFDGWCDMLGIEHE